MAQGFNAPGAPTPVGIFSSAAWQPEGRVLYVSGHLSADAEGNLVGAGDMRAQTKQTLTNIQTVLSAAGGVMSDIAKMTFFVADLSRGREVQEVRAEFFDPPYPASTLIGVSSLARPGYLIEVEAVAVIPFDRAKEPS